MAKSNRDQGQMMTRRKAVGLIIDLLLLVVSLTTGGNVANNLRIVGLVVAGVAVAVALAFCVLLAILLIDQRKPPYIEGIR
jgi:hypothetical protein